LAQQTGFIFDCLPVIKKVLTNMAMGPIKRSHQSPAPLPIVFFPLFLRRCSAPATKCFAINEIVNGFLDRQS